MKRLSFVFLATIIPFTFISPLQSEEQGPLFVEASSIPEGKALIYIYHLDANSPSLARTPLLLAKDGPVGVLPTGYYYSYVADPGVIKLWLVSLETRERKVDTVAGSIYFIKARCNSAQYGGLSLLSFELVPSETAVKEIKKCRLLSEQEQD